MQLAPELRVQPTPLQEDLPRGVKFQIEADHELAFGGVGGAATTQGTTPENDPGSSLGLLYQFEY